MSKPNQLYLLADHVKLSLLERRRAQSLDLEAGAQDGHIARSLEQFREGVEALRGEEGRLREAGDEEYVPLSLYPSEYPTCCGGSRAFLWITMGIWTGPREHELTTTAPPSPSPTPSAPSRSSSTT